MTRRPLFRPVALERFLGPLYTDAPLRLVHPRRGLLALALALLLGCAVFWLL